MRSRSRGAEPARFEAVRRRFDRWRSTRQGRARIPERLWTSAVKLAATYGLCRTARTLRLDYNALKRRVESAELNDSPAGPRPRRRMPGRSAIVAKKPGSTTRTQKRPAPAPAMRFVELTPAERVGQPLTSSTAEAVKGPPECVIELEHPRGAKMRIQLKDAGAPDLAALSRSFWGIEA